EACGEREDGRMAVADETGISRRGMGSGAEKSAKMAWDLEGILVRIHDRTADDCWANRVQPIAERRHNPKIPPAAPQRPKQVRILIAIRCDRAAVRHYDICGQEIVTSCSMNTHEPTIAAAQRKSGNANLGICPAGNRQTEGLSCAVEFAPQHSALGLRAAACGIDLDCLHEREVDHKAIIADRCTGTTVSASTHCDEKLVLARISQCDDDLLLICAKRDQRRSTINPSIPDLSSCV